MKTILWGAIVLCFSVTLAIAEEANKNFEQDTVQPTLPTYRFRRADERNGMKDHSMTAESSSLAPEVLHPESGERLRPPPREEMQKRNPNKPRHPPAERREMRDIPPPPPESEASTDKDGLIPKTLPVEESSFKAKWAEPRRQENARAPDGVPPPPPQGGEERLPENIKKDWFQ